MNKSTISFLSYVGLSSLLLLQNGCQTLPNYRVSAFESEQYRKSEDEIFVSIQRKDAYAEPKRFSTPKEKQLELDEASAVDKSFAFDLERAISEAQEENGFITNQQFPGGKTFSYVISRGDTLSSLAQKCRCSVQQIKDLNQLQGDQLYLGRKLLLPVDLERGDYATPANFSMESEGQYIVQAGDTLGAIAKRFHTTIAALQSINHIRDPKKLRIGQKLIVPSSSERKAEALGTNQESKNLEIPAPTDPTVEIPLQENLVPVGDRREFDEINSATDLVPESLLLDSMEFQNVDDDFFDSQEEIPLVKVEDVLEEPEPIES